MRFSKRKLHFYVVEINKEKKQNGKAKKPYTYSVLRWPSKNVKNQKRIFSKNCLPLFVSGREKNAHFGAHYLFWPKFLGPKTV